MHIMSHLDEGFLVKFLPFGNNHYLRARLAQNVVCIPMFSFTLQFSDSINGQING